MEMTSHPENLVRRVLVLAWFTIAYNLLEGVVSIALGVAEESVALAGFGLDSLVEVSSAILVLWRFQGEMGRAKAVSLERERRTTLGIGILFLVLAAVTGGAAVLQLASRNHPGTTLPGIVISGISLSFMFFLWNAKRDVARRLDSATVMKDADCSLACIKLSAVLFAGSLVFALFPALWWADAVAALGLAWFIGLEGRETIEAARRPGFSGGCCG